MDHDRLLDLPKRVEEFTQGLVRRVVRETPYENLEEKNFIDIRNIFTKYLFAEL